MQNSSLLVLFYRYRVHSAFYGFQINYLLQLPGTSFTLAAPRHETSWQTFRARRSWIALVRGVIKTPPATIWRVYAGRCVIRCADHIHQHLACTLCTQRSCVAAEWDTYLCLCVSWRCRSWFLTCSKGLLRGLCLATCKAQECTILGGFFLWTQVPHHYFSYHREP